MTNQCHPTIAEGKFIHGPIATGMCPLCHEEGARPANLPSQHPEVLIGKATDKCLLCHEEISALLEKGSVHTPVADGDCIDCHTPHSGDDSFFLSYPSKVEGGKRVVSTTCKACHAEGDSAWFDEFHAAETILDCVVCHNAHASSERYQLTRYVRSVYLRTILMDAADLRTRGNLDAAESAYLKALSVFPDETGTILLLAEVNEAQQEWGKALQHYDGILAGDPSHLEALAGAARVSGRSGDDGASMAYLRRALEIAPDRADLHLGIGLIYQGRGQLQEALSEMSRVVELDPDSAAGYLHLAEILEALGQSKEAAGALERHRALQDR